MDDETRAAAQLQLSNNIAPGCSSLTTQLTNYNQCPSGPEFGEPKPKKRCFRAPSDFSDEDPSLVSDSGFCDLPLYPNGLGECNQNQNGDQEVGPFFDVGNTGQLFEFSGIPVIENIKVQNNNNSTNAPVPVYVANSIRTSSLDTLSLNTELNDFPDFDDEDDVVDEDAEVIREIESTKQFLNNSTNNSSDSSSTSDPIYSNSSSLNNSTENSRGGGENQSTSEEDTSTWDHIFKNKEIANNPSRAVIMQRFLSHLRNNPNDSHLQHLLQLLLSGPEFSAPRERLRHVTTMADAIRLFRCSKKIVVLTGAGISVSCGIPDFRSKDGLYARVSKVFPFLRDPQSVFDIRLFRRDPRPFFLTAKELYPGQFEPSLSHKFIRALEKREQLLRNYSQNIDTLETIAEIQKVTMCHGSFATATCIRCNYKVKADDIKEKVLAGEVPYCPTCSTEEETSKIQYPIGTTQQSSPQSPAGLHRKPSFDDEDEYPFSAADLLPMPPVLKPDIVFFGEDLPEEFHNNLEFDKHEVDLLLVIGSSLRVRPVSMIPGMFPADIPQILINRESLPHCRFDIELLGNCDNIITHLCRSLGSDFADIAGKVELQELEKLPRVEGESDESSDEEVKVPESEDDIKALKGCWKPKVNENISKKLPADSYLAWRPRQYIFEGAEVSTDPDDLDDSSSEDESDSDSDDSESNDELSQLEAKKTITGSGILSTPPPPAVVSVVPVNPNDIAAEGGEQKKLQEKLEN